jgi:hypothetical protein
LVEDYGYKMKYFDVKRAYLITTGPLAAAGCERVYGSSQEKKT